MNKNLFFLTGLVCTLFLAQIACSLPGSSETQVDGSQPVSPPEQQASPPEVSAPEGSEPQPTPPPAQSGPGNQQGDPPRNQQGSQQGSQQGNQQSQGSQPCKDGFLANANITNGQTFQPGDSFQVVWTLENTGDCTWDSNYTLKLLGGDIITSQSLLPVTNSVNPGGTTILSADMQAPSAPGNYFSAWKMEDGQGHDFGQGTPPTDPWRLNIKVLPAGNQGNNPTPAPTTVPQDPDMLISGAGETLLDGQCFDLNTGQEVDCSDSAADVEYQYSAMLNGKIHGENNTDLAQNIDDQPDKAYCEGETYSSMPHSTIAGKFFCFQISSVMTTTYGWIRVESFDQNGITFDFLTFKADPPQAVPVNPSTVFAESQEDQVTVLVDKCYDVLNGQHNEQCTGSFFGILYEEAIMIRNQQTMKISPNDVTFASAMSSEPAKSDCQNASYSQNAIWQIADKEYYCYKFISGADTYYGWLRPTHFNTNGMTFDYLTWKATP